MSSASTYLAAAAAVGAASEATGTTAFTPLGQQAREGFELEAPGGGGPSTAALLSAVQGAGQGGTSIDLDLGALGQQGDGGAEAVAELASRFAEQQAETFERFQERAQEEREKAEERAEETTETDPRDSHLWQLWQGRVDELEDGLEETTAELEEWAKEQEERIDEATEGGDGGLGLPGLPGGIPGTGFDLDLGDGNLTDTAVSPFIRTGKTYTETAKALYGEEYDPSGTLAEPVVGPENRRIDWSKYQISDAPDVGTQVTDVVPDLPERDSDYDGPTLEGKAWENIKSKFPGGDSPSSSSSSTTRKSSTVASDTSGDRRLLRAAEEIEEENRRKRNAPAGGRVL